MAEAQASANRAINIAPRLGAAYNALALVAQNRVDFRDMLRQTEKALALSPDDPNVLLDASITMALLGRFEEGLRLADKLIALDGLSARSYARKAYVLMLMRRYPQAIASVRRADAIAPGNPTRTAIAGDSWLLLGQPVKAKAEYAKMPPDDFLRLTGEALIAARTGDRRGAEGAIERMRQSYGPSLSYQYAMILAQLGEIDRAFAELDNALAAKDPGLVSLKVDAFLDPIRSDARYAALVRRLNFPS